jgi:hypothetical protein
MAETNTKYATREAWLEAAAEAMQTKCGIRDENMPRISVGFPSKGALASSRKRLGECWHPKTAEDGRSQILITPLLSDPAKVLEVVLHELGHVKHPDAGHGKPFKQFMRLVDLDGKATATHAGPQATAWLGRIAEDLGPYPHAELRPSQKEKKQTTRLLKATCDQCECTIRITAKWVGDPDDPTLPFCGVCTMDGNVDSMVRMKLA